MEKKIMYSGIKPSGRLTLGNYIGSINQWEQMQDDYNCLYCVADLHAITERQDPKSLREISLALFAQYVSAGIDPEKSIMYFQSHVAEHAELSWILSCLTYMGELNRMTQYKVKSQKGGDNLNAGLFTYPILMASDILLYQTDYVPVGDDQTQHVELTRDIAVRFNNRYSDTFKVPEAVNPKVGARIMSLQDPTKKMSKSDENVNASIYIVDDDDLIARKIKKAVTDSEGTIKYNENRPAIRNLMEIYSSLSEKSYEEIEQMFDGKGYGDFKSELSDLVISKISPIRDRYLELMTDKGELESIYKNGADQARRIAVRTLDKVKRKTGFILR